jgi:hypothetical protein
MVVLFENRGNITIITTVLSSRGQLEFFVNR